MALLSGNSNAFKSVDRVSFAATAGQTTFTLNQGYNVGEIDVFLNGIKLVDIEDYSAVNGTTIILNSACTVGDNVQVVSFNQFLAANTYTKTEADNRYMTASGITPMTSYLRAPNYGVSSWSDSANVSLEASVGAGTSGVGIKAWGRSVATSGGELTYVSDTRGASGQHIFYGFNGTSLVKFGGFDSSGRFTNPLKPIASVSDSRTLSITDAELTSSNFYDTIWLNNGGHFNASTGRFTCPVAGIYRIFFRCSSTGSGCNVRLRKNGVGINEAYGGGGTDYQTVCSEAVVSCVAGDYLHIQVSTLYAIGGPQHKQVTFELLG